MSSDGVEFAGEDCDRGEQLLVGGGECREASFGEEGGGSDAFARVSKWGLVLTSFGNCPSA
jgi:hypothetical protein